MNAPDKLYVVPMKTESQDAFVGLAYELDRLFVRKTEYIRKDALLEWAKEQASITEKLNGRGAMLKAWDTLIDKIESL